MKLSGLKSPPGRTIRVANIIEEARLGGPQNRIAEVAARLREDGIETTVILPDNNNQVFVQKLERLGVAYHTLPLHKLTRDKRGLLSFILHFPGDIWRVRNAINACGAQLVHCNSAGQWKGAIAARLIGRPALWHLNDTNMPGPVKPIFRLVARRVTGFILAAARVADYYLKDRFASKPRFLIQAPVDCSMFESEKRTQTKEGSDPINVICVGNVSPVKDVEAYVGLALSLQSRSPKPVFSFIGEPLESQKAYLKKIDRLNNSSQPTAVAMLGRKRDVRPYLQAADIYVCTSRFEASPISIWEAMAMGLPIVATDVGDIARMNEEGDFARVVPTENAAALASVVTELINAPDERKRLGANARKYALENLDINICVRKHAAAYREVLGTLAHVPPALCRAKGGHREADS